MAALEYRASRLVRGTDAATGRRTGFGEQGASEVVSARSVVTPCVHMSCPCVDLRTSYIHAVQVHCRQRGRSGGSSGGLGGSAGGGESELNLQRQRLGSRRKALQRKLAEVRRMLHPLHIGVIKTQLRLQAAQLM